MALSITDELRRVGASFAREDRQQMADLMFRAATHIENTKKAGRSDRKRLLRLTETGYKRA